MQGASTLAPVPGKARESRKTDVCIPLSHFAWGFVFFLHPTVTVPLTIRVQQSWILFGLLIRLPLTAKEVQFTSDDI